ncbi:MAG: hypothetical protein KAH38_08720, partial [Candidatus Hydrogenedentes bacterium]|nr:hypothetical protein [Candidatus Hydrogenedentota bacterium]
QPDGTAMVQVYSSYMPRNITRLQFKITTVPDLPWTVVKTDNDNGGLVGSGDWSLTADPATGIITLEVASPATPLLYGDWGSLVDITFTGIAVDSFVFDFEMLAPYYDPDSPDGKFFAYINWLEVGAEPRSETFYPHPVRVFTPKFDSPETRRIITDSLEEPVRLDILNIGFEHLKFDRLLWKVVFTGGGAPDTTPVTAVFDYYQQYSSLGLSYPSIDPYDADDYFYIPAYYDEPPLPVGRANSGLFTPTIPLDGGGNPEPGRYSVEFYVDGGYVDSYSFVGSEAVFHRNFYGPYYLIYEIN